MQKSYLFIVLVLFTAGRAHAVDDAVRERLTESIKALAPSVTISSIEPSPIPGLYEVVADMRVLYMTGDGRYLLQGNIFDTENRVDVTAGALGAIRNKALAGVDPAKQITFAPPANEVRHEVTVFTDIDCGYCRKLHSQIKDYNEYGIAVHYMFFPRGGLNSHSFDKAVSVWCADDSKAALTAAKQGNEPKPLQCENPIKEQFLLGQRLGITGTPGIFTENGTLLPGYLPPAVLAQRLDAMKGADKPAAQQTGSE